MSSSLFIQFHIGLEIEDGIFLLFVRKKEEIKDGYFNENKILLEYSQTKEIRIRYDEYEIEKEHNEEMEMIF